MTTPFDTSSLPESSKRSLSEERVQVGREPAVVLKEVALRRLDRSRLSCRTIGDHCVDDPVALGIVGAEEEVSLHVMRDPLDVLPCVLGVDLLQAALEPDDLASLDLDVGALSLEAARELVHQDAGAR